MVPGAVSSLLLTVRLLLKLALNCPSMPLFGGRLRSLAAAIRSYGFGLTFTWVPAHNRHPGWTSPCSDFSAEQLRSLNDAVDRTAKACVDRRLRGSLRENWFADAMLAKNWEANAVRASARAAQRLSDHLEACSAAGRSAVEVPDCQSTPYSGDGV